MSAAPPSLSAPLRSRQLLLDDCRELHRKQFLTAAQLAAFEEQVAALPSLTTPDVASASSDASSAYGGARPEPQLALLLAQVRALYQHELETIIAGIREQHNQKQHDTYVTSDLLAIAAGGAMGALNAWLRSSATATPAPIPPLPAAKKAPSLWASAFDAAQASLNVVRKRRLLEHLQIKHLSGDESVCDHVLLCINGFMTQGADPTRNWGAWCGGASVAVYAVLWEAGDVDAWNDFCAHANDHLTAPSVGAATSALLTHVSGNPWHKAQTQAEQVGALLAQVLASQPTFCRGRQVTLLGHSLGGAVIYSFFQELARLRSAPPSQQDATEDASSSECLPRIALPPTPLVTNAVSFAGAFLPTAEGLTNVSAALPAGGKFLNVFSARDSVLSKLFWAMQLHASDPVAAGCTALRFPPACAHNCRNVDVTALVPVRLTNQFGHGYAMHMDAIVRELQPHLASVYGGSAAS